MNQTHLFRELHSIPGQPLILANVWDAGGARIVESRGANAVATTSAGVAWSQGYRDGNQLPAIRLAHLAEQIVKAVKIPVSVDFEGGYSSEPSAVAENLKPLLAAGVSGINLEDGPDAPAILAGKIEAIKKLAASLGLDVFVNARTDVYLRDLVTDGGKVRETLHRAAAYRAAGADGLFVPGLTDAAQIAEITGGAGLPVNLMADSELPKLDALAKLNVRRLSAGAAISKILNKHFARLAESFLKSGDCAVLDEDAMTFAELQGLFGG